MKDCLTVSKMEGKTNFSRRLKQFDGLTSLTLTPIFYDRSTPLAEDRPFTLSHGTARHASPCSQPYGH